MENKIKPYLKLIYFQDDVYLHNNSEIIIEDEKIINKIMELI